MYRYYLVWLGRQERGTTVPAVDPQLITYSSLRSSWHCYLNLLDTDVKNSFLCNKDGCRNAPSVILCDATSLAYHQLYHESRKSAITISDETMIEDKLLESGR